MKFTPIFFSGGLKCIDFCNTYDHHRTPPAYDFFTDRATVLQWGQAGGILLTDFQDPYLEEVMLPECILKARRLIFQLLVPFTRFETPKDEDLAAFNQLFQDVSARLEVAPGQAGYALGCCTDDPLEKVFCEVVRSTADLLLSNQPERIKQCKGCGWLFYDSTRNRSRRWCDMKSCGNKAKAHRHYERVKQNRVATV